MYKSPSVWYSGRGAVPCGSITLAARTAATAFAFHCSATVAGTTAASLRLAEDGSTTASTAASKASTTATRTLISKTSLPASLVVLKDGNEREAIVDE